MCVCRTGRRQWYRQCSMRQTWAEEWHRHVQHKPEPQNVWGLGGGKVGGGVVCCAQEPDRHKCSRQNGEVWGRVERANPAVRGGKPPAPAPRSRAAACHVHR